MLSTCKILMLVSECVKLTFKVDEFQKEEINVMCTPQLGHILLVEGRQPSYFLQGG